MRNIGVVLTVALVTPLLAQSSATYRRRRGAVLPGSVTLMVFEPEPAPR
jgi:hypothetical protein